MTDGFVVNPPIHVPVGNDIDIITKVSLQKLHAEQLLLYGPSSKQQQQDIIDALGGFDQLLGSLWKSDIVIEKKQCLYDILCDPAKYGIQKRQQNKIKKNNSDNKKEDKAQNHHQAITYSFDDDDMILRSVFNKRIAVKLSQMVFSKGWNVLIIVILVSTFYLPGIMLDRYEIINLNTQYLIQTAGLIISCLFGICWILTINYRAMALLIRDFTFWFKYFYLILYLVTNAWLWIRAEDEGEVTPAHFIFANTLLQTIMFSLTMVIDCLNINQISKVLLSMIAMFFLADNILGYQLVSLYRNDDFYGQYYERTNVIVTLPEFFNIQPLTFNIFDYAATSAQILTIFSLKQIFSTILQPNKAAVLKKYPLIVYGDANTNKNKVISAHSLKVWKMVSIGYWCVLWLYVSLLLVTIEYDGRILTMISWILYVIIMGLQFKSSLNALHVSIICALLILGLYAFGILFFGWTITIGIYTISLGFAISAIYTLRVKLRSLAADDQKQSSAHTHTLVKMTSVSIVSSPSLAATNDKQIDEKKDVISTKIDMQNVHNATLDDKIDREKSMDSILDRDDDSHSTTMSQSVPL